MNDAEKTKYLANIYYVVASDGEVARIEERVFEEIARDIGAGFFDRKEAIGMAESQGLQTNVAARWSDRIRNLEDMIFAAYCNETLEPTEKKAIVGYANQLGIDQQQLSLIKQEAKRRHEEV